jgi:mono/diheme cytochrome c family protein
MNKWGAGISLAVAFVAGIAVTALVPAEEAPSTSVVEPEMAESGKELYLRHCAVCHGVEGFGNGPLAEAMILAPSDLTTVSAKHNGTYPRDKVADVVRTGGGVLGHGSTAMPAWGLYFAVKRQPEVARARIKALVDYIESIQTK